MLITLMNHIVKLETLKESYFQKTLTEVVDETIDDVDTGWIGTLTPLMMDCFYGLIIGRTVKSKITKFYK